MSGGNTTMRPSTLMQHFIKASAKSSGGQGQSVPCLAMAPLATPWLRRAPRHPVFGKGKPTQASGQAGLPLTPLKGSQSFPGIDAVLYSMIHTITRDVMIYLVEKGIFRLVLLDTGKEKKGQVEKDQGQLPRLTPAAPPHRQSAEQRHAILEAE